MQSRDAQQGKGRNRVLAQQLTVSRAQQFRIIRVTVSPQHQQTGPNVRRFELREILMFPVRLVMSLLIAVAVLPSALAQAQYLPDSGEYLILSAQYGTERNHVDVTNRLKELARRDRTFVMGNNTFGVDPDYGRVKVLRIFARGPDGRDRMFEFRESSLVDGSQFRGWGRGDWGQGWTGRWEVGGDYD